MLLPGKFFLNASSQLFFIWKKMLIIASMYHLVLVTYLDFLKRYLILSVEINTHQLLRMCVAGTWPGWGAHPWCLRHQWTRWCTQGPPGGSQLPGLGGGNSSYCSSTHRLGPPWITQIQRRAWNMSLLSILCRLQ